MDGFLLSDNSQSANLGVGSFPDGQPCAIVEYPLDEDAANILGPEPGGKPSEDTDLHPAVLRRWQAFLKKGLSPDDQAALCAEYSVAEGGMLFAPHLNPELVFTLEDNKDTKSAVTRDGYFHKTQTCLGAALLAHGQALSCIVADNESLDRPFVLQRLHDSGRLLTDVFFQLSQSRRALLIPQIADKLDRKVLASLPTEGTLFGPNLATKLKEAKAAAAVGHTLFTSGRKPALKGAGNANGLFGRWGQREQTDRTHTGPSRRWGPGPSRYQPYQPPSHRRPQPSGWKTRR